MTKPLFASKWFKDVPAAELRQETQNLYRIISQLAGDVEEEVTTREAADTELQKDVADLRTDITSLEEDVTALDTNKVNRAGDTITGDLDVLGALLHNGNAVVEHGSNANGEYVRFADGTQIAWTTVQTGAINNAYGGVYVSAAVGGQPWPASFFGDAPKVVSQTLSDIVNAPRWHGHGTSWGSTSTTPPVWAFAAVSTHATATIRMVGIGRWKE